MIHSSVAVLLCGVMVAGGCAPVGSVEELVFGPPARGLSEQITQDSLVPVAAQKFRGVPTDRVVRCLIENADAAQLNALALDSAQGTTEATSDIVTDIAFKAETRLCLRGDGIFGLLDWRD